VPPPSGTRSRSAYGWINNYVFMNRQVIRGFDDGPAMKLAVTIVTVDELSKSLATL
jgi:hypothetical protein